MDITVHKFSGQPNLATTVNQIHLHSTGNPKATVENEVKYLVDNGGHKNAFYTHIVGQGKVYQVANTGRGAWDVGGGWNHNTYAAIEFSELVNSKAEFEQSYKLYIALARQLAKQGGIAIQYNTGSKGLMTHDYCSKHQPANQSDHVDPMPFLNKWGISEAQFKNDLLNGISGEATFTNVATTSVPAASAQVAPGKLVVDGYLGPKTILALQVIYDMKWQDGVISKPSQLIKVLQKHLGVTQDGYMGPITIKAMQRVLGTVVDGVISQPSLMIKAMQVKLNAGIKPF